MADNNKATSLDNVKQYVKGVLQGWFSNKATLDKLSTATNGDLLYNNIPVGAGSSVTVDVALSATSENPVQNKVIYSALEDKANASDIPDTSGLATQSAVTAALALKQDALTFDSSPTANSTNPVTSGGVYTALQNVPGGSTITVDTTLSATSENPVQNKAIYSALQNISGGTSAIVDSMLSSTSENPVQNKVIKAALDGKADASAIPDVSNFVTTQNLSTGLATKQDTLTFDSTPTQNSSNPVTSGGVYSALQGASFSLSPATTSTLGGIIVGDNLTVDQNGRLSAGAIPDVSGFALASSLSAVATSGDYSDLINTPNVYTKTEVDNLVSSSVCDDTPMSEVETMLDRIFGTGGSSGVKIVSFANGTDAEIAAMLAAHYAGEINIHDFWRVGDTRSIPLSAMSAWGTNGETHVAQTVDIVLVNAGGYTTGGNTECAFVWQQKDGLIEPGYMNATATNNNGWSGSARRSWASVYKQALPGYFKDLMKTCTIRTARENQAGTLYVDSQDELFLPSMTEVYGTITDQNSVVWTNGYEGNQWDYYKTEANIYDKKMGTIENAGSTRLFYWLRSPDRSNANSFMRVPIYRGTPKGSQANTVTTSTSQYTYHYMIVPCGFI